jgi:putative protein-disulfide isomerase
MKLKALIILTMLAIFCCQAQTNKEMIESNIDPLLCAPQKGMCEIPTSNKNEQGEYTAELKKTAKIIYFTDPICSSCWGIEPQLRKLKLEYGNNIDIEYRMGGLLPDWSYNSGGISKPSDVAHHWDEVSQYYDMPIDGDVWLEDPLSSSYPPSIAFKAAQMQDEQKAIKFLRRIREMVFLEKKNITKWEHISKAANEVALDVIKLKMNYETNAKEQFEADLALGRKLAVRGFPTLFFIDSSNNQQIVYGVKPYNVFENALLKTFPNAEKKHYDISWIGLFIKYPTLTTREFSELANLSNTDSETLLQRLTDENKLKKTTIKNGSIWAMKNASH